jgi:steroid 5-alpha reductase family enzyme
MTEKTKGLLYYLVLYAAAFALGMIPFHMAQKMLWAELWLTLTATAVVFLASCVHSDTSLYDPYWSVAPPVILLAVMIRWRLWTVNAWVLLALIGLWSARLTANWYAVYPGPGREDWRYARYRARCSGPVFLLLSLVGLHLVPTAVVYAGLVSGLLAARQAAFSVLSLPGAALMAAAVVLESVSDRAIHRFLAEHPGERRTCDVSVWHWSRHPNYLGEMAFWTGLFLYWLPLSEGRWYRGLGFLAVIALFLLVSIPMMERHNAERRSDWDRYREATPMLLPLPRRHGGEP